SGSSEWQAAQARYMRSPLAALPGSAVAEWINPVSESAMIAMGAMWFIIDLHWSAVRGRAAAQPHDFGRERKLTPTTGWTRSDARRPERGSAGLGAETGIVEPRPDDGSRTRIDEQRRNAGIAETFQHARRHRSAVAGRLVARIGRMRAAIVRRCRSRH